MHRSFSGAFVYTGKIIIMLKSLQGIFMTIYVSKTTTYGKSVDNNRHSDILQSKKGDAL